MAPHYATPAKAHLLGIASFLEGHHIPYFKTDLFRHFGISKTRGWDILFQGPEHERRHLTPKTRGRKPIIMPEDLGKMEAII